MIGGIVLALPLLARLLPEYVPGIPSARVLLVGTFFLSLVSSASSFLVATERHRPLLAVQAVAVVLNLGLNLLALRLGHGILGIAWATSVSYTLYAIGVHILTHRSLRTDSRETAAEFLLLLLPYGLLLAGAAILARVLPASPGNELGPVALRLVLYLVVAVPVLGLLAHRRGLLAELRALRSPGS